MKKQKFLQVLIAAIFVLGTFGFATPQQAAITKAQPQLQELAAQEPGQLVRVIAQKMAGAQGVEALVTELGGQVVTDLSIINAFAAEMTADAALELAQSEGVRWVSLDAPTESAGKPQPPSEPTTPTLPENYYLDTLGVRDVWAMGLKGQGIGVAIIDSGITLDADFGQGTVKRLVWQASFNANSTTPNDLYGHGTHVAGIIGGEGTDSAGRYTGVAPKVNLISLKVNDDSGMAYESDVVAAMQWIYDNKAKYNIRVVNLSLNSTVESSYHTSPMNAAAEILWFNGVVVVVSAGNKTADTGYDPIFAAPANDPFVITVGATDEKGTSRTRDDVIASFSSLDETIDGFLKPEIHAPGVNIVSVLASSSPWDDQYPDRVVMDGQYFRISGTSMAAPMVTGTIALLLQDEPNLTPDQVKYRLLATAGSVGKSAYLNTYATVTGTSTESANQGLLPSQLLSTGSDPIAWGSVGWNSVGWNSVGWNSVGWNSVGWNSVGWNSTFWGQ